jgi:hypothetical protein
VPPSTAAGSGATAAGVASGGGGGEGGGGSGLGPLARAWVTLAKQEGPSYAHAGLLMALGLRGHLEQLSWTDLYM